MCDDHDCHHHGDHNEGLTRRKLLVSGAARGIAAVGMPVILAGLVGPAIAQGEDPTEAWQPDWRFCVKCHQLFYDGYPEKGICAGGDGGHVAAGYNFTIYTNQWADELVHPNIQYRWRFCGNCYTMFYQDLNVRCANGGSHYPIGWKFGLHHDLADSSGQDLWRFCVNCGALFFDGYPEKGKCAGTGGGHVAAGYNFRLYYQAEATEPQTPEPTPTPAQQFLSVSPLGGGVFAFSGSGYNPGSNVMIRVADDALHLFNVGTLPANQSGSISGQFTIPCGPGMLHFSATDGRAGGDLTGFTWSNYVDVACQ